MGMNFSSPSRLAPGIARVVSWEAPSFVCLRVTAASSMPVTAIGKIDPGPKDRRARRSSFSMDPARVGEWIIPSMSYALGHPTELHGTLRQRALPALALQVMQHLLEAGLPDVDVGKAGGMGA